MSSIILNPFQLLELNIISGQDLANVSRSMRTYAVAWVHPDRKLSTRVDSKGRCNPTWNDKFVFRVDDDFLRVDTSAIMIEIYAVHWFRDVLVGTVRVLVGNLPTPPPRPFRPQHQIGMRFVALQVRRPSGRPQGILNVGISVLDSSMRSMPLYTAGSSAVGYLDLMGEQNQQNNKTTHQNHQLQKKKKKMAAVKLPDLRRTKSDTSSIQLAAGAKTLRRKVSFREKPNSVINATSSTSYSVQDRAKKSISKRSSVVSDSYFANGQHYNKSPKMRQNGKKGKDGSVLGFSPTFKISTRPKWAANMQQQTKNHTNNNNSDIVLDFESTNKPAAGVNKLLYLTESELGPSPSELAAQLAAKEKYKLNDAESSIVGGWSLTGSVEGLQSKLERWRMELPAVYDSSMPITGGGGGGGGQLSDMIITNKGGGGSNHRNRRHSRRNTDGGGVGLFSCVSNICGCECSIACGDDPSKP